VTGDTKKIRVMISKDTERAAYIVNECWKTTYQGYVADVQLSTQWCQKRADAIRSEVESGSLENFVYDDGQVQGILTCGKCCDEDKTDAFELWRIYVDVEKQGQKIGSKLLKFGENLAREEGFSEIIIWAFSKNKPACEFYRKNGYEILDKKQLGENFHAEGVRFRKIIS